MGVRQAQAAIDSREFGEWLRYVANEPSDGEKTVVLLALLCELVYNGLYAGRPGYRPLRADDFMPRKRAAGQSISQMKAIFRAYVEAHNAWQSAR